MSRVARGGPPALLPELRHLSAHVDGAGRPRRRRLYDMLARGGQGRAGLRRVLGPEEGRRVPGRRRAEAWRLGPHPQRGVRVGREDGRQVGADADAGLDLCGGARHREQRVPALGEHRYLAGRSSGAQR